MQQAMRMLIVASIKRSPGRTQFFDSGGEFYALAGDMKDDKSLHSVQVGDTILYEQICEGFAFFVKRVATKGKGNGNGC